MPSTDTSDPSPDAPPGGTRLSAWMQAARSARVGMLRLGAMVRRKPVLADAAATNWTGTLEQVIAELVDLNHGTEQDFLSIGGKLAEFIDAVNVISSELTALANLISGEHGVRASQALTDALDHSVKMRERYAHRSDGLGGMREEAGRLKRTLSGFQGTVSTFQTLGVLTRIEAARLGSAGADFATLADDVKLMGTDVKVRVDSALDTAALLIAPIERAMQNISALDEGQARELPSVIAGVQSSLASFRVIQTRAHESSVRLATQYEAISKAFKKLIVSIQFHDITRQQVEHVIEVLRRLCAESEAEAGGPPRRDVAAVLTLQSLQLADAGEKFAASVAAVARNLDDIAAHVLEMADESRTLSGLSEDEKNSFFLQMEQGCATILTSLSQCASAEAATRETSSGLTETIGRMGGSIGEIRAIEIQMQRMAMNASIRAAHIGTSGDALSVLAGSMQEQASESRQRSEALVEALSAMSGAATLLSGRDRATSAGESGTEDSSLEGLRTAVAELHSSGQRSVTHIAQIVASGASLSENLATTRKGFSVGALFDMTVSRARGMLKEIGETHPSGSSDGGSERSAQGLAEFAGHYTMQSELDVLKNATRATGPVLVAALPTHIGQTEPADQVEPPDRPPAEADELGDNVEFF